MKIQNRNSTSFTQMRRAVLIAVSCLFLSLANASERNGQWIWQESDGPANSWVAFRKTFDLTETPTEAIASIAADSKYWLWVNGSLVRFEGGRAAGPSPASPWKREKDTWTRPASEKPRNTWYQDIDLGPYLVKGENLVAVLVWHWGRETHKGTHIDSGKGGLYFQLDLGGQTIASDKSWKTTQHPAYALDSGEVDRSVVQYDVAFDANKAMGDWSPDAWYRPDFDASAWPAATEKGQPGSAPWYSLIRDDVPPLKDHGLQAYSNYDAKSFPIVSDGNEIRARLPRNLQITPYIEIESKNGGETISITTDNRLNRMDATYSSRSGRQSFESYSWMNGHEVIYKIPAGVKVLDLKFRALTVGEIEGSFSISDPFLQRLWDMGANTLMVCARDNFMDCPDRERALWIGDVADQTSYLFYVMGTDGRALLERAIRSTFLFSEDGTYGALGPLRIRELPSQSLQFVNQCVWEYYMNTGDREIIEYSLPYIYDYLAKWEMGENGLPKYLTGTSPDRWNWVDWGEKDTHDSTIIQAALYYDALTAAHAMAVELHQPQKADWFSKRMASIKASFDKTYWTGKYYSSDPAKLQDDRANALAILTGLAGPERYQAVVENVLIPNHFCSPHFEWMVNLAMCQAGYTQAAIDRMKTRYQAQVDREWLTTLYEMFPNGGSYNHAWNAPNAVLARKIAGIVPSAPGWKEFTITPDLLDIDQLSQKIPSVMGDIEIAWTRTDKTLQFEILVPEGCTARINVPKDALKKPATLISVAGKKVWRANKQASQPVQGLSVEGESAARVSLSLTHGSWTIDID